ncbi:4-alpha-glucanotransferase [Tieghemostelium lacteum]|uniref:4-alpha-glucanotransferase n=1 Tax=Tieghemostelium lacteum TaxID=361077 RepID=A0A151ZJF9_TIELA|nr:4-alpha-glucanotransferase [Tieghemostelium lacteum]|eukprot:KYQ94039.1 4-alpha-glucanotransferase [Tieghemostelium lacteum]
MTNYIRFKVNYYTRLGQEIFVCGSSSILGNWKSIDAQKLKYGDNGDWELLLAIEQNQQSIVEYKYFVMDTNGEAIWEAGPNRKFDLSKLDSSVVHEFRDTYQSSTSPENTYYNTSFFREVLFKRSENIKAYQFIKSSSKDKVVIHFQVKATYVPSNYSVYIVGSNITLGNWRTDKSIQLSDEDYPVWKVDLEFTKDQLPFSYKYIISDKTRSYVHWEQGSDRWFTSSVIAASDYSLTKAEERDFFFNDGEFKDSQPQLRTTGVAIPIFSLRTNNGLGVGEFNDIKLLVDWAHKVNLHMLQILPINDTTVFSTWRDSYPYSAVSVFALHPIYINIDQLTQDKNILAKVQEHKSKLNKLTTLDYEIVFNLKIQLLKEIYEQEKSKLDSDKEFLKFLSDNKNWIKQYALYSVLRDHNKTADFTKWPEYKTITPDEIEKETSSGSKYYDKIRFYYFVQYHLHLQLLQASKYAASKRIGLKGDLPIGVNRLSVDTWCDPQLFRMNMSTGAPPDAFSDDGQNWGFPTYNWDVMKKDNYAWWRQRLGQMSQYFHAFRIDHILGFFRIWEISTHNTAGLLGKFNPSLPIWKSELSNNGIWDIERLTKPYIRYHTLRELFGDYADVVSTKFLKEYFPNCYQMLPQFNNEKLIDGNLQEEDAMYKPGLYKLVQNVCLIADPEGDENRFYPRIDIMKTSSYNELPDDIKSILYRLYISYFYERQEELWAQTALQRLPIIKSCTNMLVCGEDLGMVPKCVEPVLKDLGILGLRIQRMPADSSKDFYYPSEYGYLTVNTTSSHDMSTLRGWWEEDRARSQVFFNKVLGMYGEAPYFCESYVSQSVIAQHLQSPSMISIFPIQDWFGLNAELTKRDPKEEKINEPSNPFHYWRYRMHISVEELLENSDLNQSIVKLIHSSNRNLTSA